MGRKKNPKHLKYNLEWVSGALHLISHLLFVLSVVLFLQSLDLSLTRLGNSQAWGIIKIMLLTPKLQPPRSFQQWDWVYPCTSPLLQVWAISVSSSPFLHSSCSAHPVPPCDLSFLRVDVLCSTLEGLSSNTYTFLPAEIKTQLSSCVSHHDWYCFLPPQLLFRDG